MNNIPPNIQKRNEFGLLENIDYKFNEQGFVDWKSMVNSEFLYVNSDPKRRAKLEEKYGKKYDEIDPIKDNVEDTDLIIMLGGLRQLLRIRGFTNVSYWIKESNENYASVTCSIDFISSFESEGNEQSYSENACAHQGNTTNFAKNYLLEIASNRALARCIRAYLGIQIVSKEELQGYNTFEEETPKSNSIISPTDMLSKLLKDKNISFGDAIKGVKGTENCKSIEDLNKSTIFLLIGKIKAENK